MKTTAPIVVPKIPAYAETVRALPARAKCVTNAILTRGNRIRQGWEAPEGWFETFHYPGALNFAQVVKLTNKPDWATT